MKHKNHVIISVVIEREFGKIEQLFDKNSQHITSRSYGG